MKICDNCNWEGLIVPAIWHCENCGTNICEDCKKKHKEAFPSSVFVKLEEPSDAKTD